MTRCDIQHTGLGYRVTKKRQFFLEPGDARQFSSVSHLKARHRLGIRPYTQTFIGQALPRKQRPRVQLAQRRYIAVTNDVLGVDAIALADVLEQHYQRLYLGLGIRVPQATPWACR